MDFALTSVMTFTGLILLVVFALVVFQEAINGFHDVANAIATVIYANALTPTQSVLLAAAFNFLGVMLGGTAVAFGLVYLLPETLVAGIDTRGEAALFFAMIVAAVVWNFGTWWLGIPNSTTHAYIGAILGISMADAFLRGQAMLGHINWLQGEKVLLALMLSPVVGFVLGWILLKLIRFLDKNPAMHQPVQGNQPPRPAIRGVLVAGAAGVSLMHGSNDGQKSIGLMMVVLFGLLPAVYGLDPARLGQADYARLAQRVSDATSVATATQAMPLAQAAQATLAALTTSPHLPGGSNDTAVRLRQDLLHLNAALTTAQKNVAWFQALDADQQKKVREAQAEVRDFVEHVPFWVMLLSAIALGGGTLVGYRKIVVTLGEKMGSARMNPGQGIAAQLSAVVSIGLADAGGLPVSTTHVLSSAVIGSVAASPHQSINHHTLVRIVMTWVTTLPGTLLLSFALGVVFHLAFA